MNSFPAFPDDSTSELARLYAQDTTAQTLGIRITAVGARELELSWAPPQEFCNGHGILHGGFTFLLADTALAYLCAAIGNRAVTRSAEITYLNPVEAGQELLAHAQVRAAHHRTILCDVRVTTVSGTICAEFRGNASIR